MLLLKIRDRIRLVGSVTLTDLARHFDMPESAMQGMVEQWVRKGDVTAVDNGGACGTGSCGGCAQGGCATGAVKYVWRND